MRKLLITIFIVLTALPCFGAFTTSIDTKKTYKNAYRWTGKPKDKLLLWAQEVEDRIDGTLASNTFLYLTPTTAPGSPSEGYIYYDDSGDVLKFRNGSSAWVTLASSSSGTLDEAYDAGTGITVDNGAVTFTATDAANNVAFAIIQSDTAGAVAQTITSAGTGALLSFDSNGSGPDLLGSDSTWTITKAGVATFVGVNNTGDSTFTGSNYVVLFDVDQDTFHWADNAVLGFGNTATTPDVTILWNTSNLLIESAAEDTGEVRFGSTNAIDVSIYANTNSKIALFNANTATLELNGFDLQLQDSDFLMFGDDDDFTFTSDGAAVLKLATLATDESPILHLGANTSGMDVKFYPTTTAEYMLWDAGNEALEFVGGQIHLDDTSIMEYGSGKDFTVYSDTANTLEFDPATAGNTIKFGTSNTDAVDFLWYSDVAGETIEFDEELGVASFGTTDNGIDLICWGATASQRAWWDESGDEWFFGDDAEGVDVTFNGDNTGNYIIWDESLDTMVHVGGHSKYDDDAIAYFGTGTNITTADGDFSVNFTDGSPGKLVWTSIADDQFIIGNGTNRTDFVIDNATTATNDVWFDAAGDTNKGVWYFGVDNEGVDVYWYGATTTQFMQFDASADEFLVDTIKVNIMDDTLLTFGDGDDVTMNYDEDGDNDLQVTGPVSFEGVVTGAVGIQVTVGETMTTAGTEGATGTIDAGVSVANVTTSTGVTEFITLPNNAAIGTVVVVLCNAGGNFEIRTLLAGDDTINTVDTSNGGTEYLATDTDMIIFTRVSANNWAGSSYPAAGGIRAAVTPDA